MSERHATKNGLIVGVLALLAGGCAAGPDYRPTQTYAALAELPPADSLANWWTRFDQPELDALIAAALTQNRQIEAARASVREASAGRRAARAGFLPVAGFDGAYTWSEQSINSPAGAGPLIGAGIVDRDIEFWNGTVSTRWDLNLFGGTRRLNEAARARVQQAMAARDAVALGVVGETVAAWIELNGALSRRERLAGSIEALDQTVTLTQRQSETGLGRPLDALRSVSQRDAAAAGLPTLDAAIDAAAWRLAVLTGQPLEAIAASPDRFGARGLDHQLAGMTIPTVTAAYLRQRPDVAAAERNLAAAVADVGVSEAAFWPQVWIGASVGVESASVGNLLEGDSRALGLAPRFSIPLFQGGRLKAGRDAALARADIAYQDLENTLVSAYAEARSVARRVERGQASLAKLTTAVDAAREAETIAQRRFELGLGSFLALLDAQRERLRLEDQQIVQATQVQLYIGRLFTSLGGDAPSLLPAQKELASSARATME
ncbi:MAG: efflux transporter outer membrane subunit [Pseudomonadota bacterium]